MKKTYSPKESAQLIARVVIALKPWDRKETLQAYRHPKNRCDYTYDHYLDDIGQKAIEKRSVTDCHVSCAI